MFILLQLNGRVTLGENIADNGGVKEAFRAYQKYIKRNPKQERLPVIDSYTAEQQFFISYANVWTIIMILLMSRNRNFPGGANIFQGDGSEL